MHCAHSSAMPSPCRQMLQDGMHSAVLILQAPAAVPKERAALGELGGPCMLRYAGEPRAAPAEPRLQLAAFPKPFARIKPLLSNISLFVVCCFFFLPRKQKERWKVKST